MAGCGSSGSRRADVRIYPARPAARPARTSAVVGGSMPFDHGFTTVAASTALAVMGVFNFLGTIASGWLADRRDPRRLLLSHCGFREVSLLYLPSIHDAVSIGSIRGPVRARLDRDRSADGRSSRPSSPIGSAGATSASSMAGSSPPTCSVPRSRPGSPASSAGESATIRPRSSPLAGRDPGRLRGPCDPPIESRRDGRAPRDRRGTKERAGGDPA